MIRADKKTKDKKESNVSVGEICIKMNFSQHESFFHDNLICRKI
jgi:hypothetical protein